MVKKTSIKPQTQAIKAVTQELFSQLGFSDASIEVIQDSTGLTTINLNTSPETSGILIGYHGETITSLQMILSLIAYKSLGQWPHLVLNINDYRQKREQSLMEMAKSAADRAKATGQEVVLPPMGSFDRRIIHMTLSDDEDITTASVGEGRDRRVTIHPQSQS